MKKNQNVSAPAMKGKGRRWLRITLAAVLVIAAAVLTWYLMRYQLNNEYRRYVAEPAAAEPGTEFIALEDASPAVAGFALAAENDRMKLYAKVETGEVAVHNKISGKTVYSNPQAADKDKVANKTNKNYLKSQFTVDYFNAGLTSNNHDSFSKCVDQGKLKAEKIENGIRFIYEKVGDAVEVYYVPQMLSDERYQELYAGVPENVQKLMYGQKSSFYEQREDGNWYMSENGAKLNTRNQNRISEAFLELGMTPEEYYMWQEKAGVEVAETLAFTIVLEWRLTDDGVECTIPADRIVEYGGGMVSKINLLCYMGAAGSDETGYIVVPNGSGAIINFNNGKTANAAYSQYVYDMDLVDAEYTKTQSTQPVRLPLFAICREDSTLMATIEAGASLASISADVSGRSNSYNNAYASFILRGDEKLSMFGAGETADLPIVEDDLYAETLTVRYTILDEPGYSGVANAYRQRLLDEGVLTVKAEGGDIPFYYDVIGGVKETAHTLGVQHLRVKAMTTFDEAAQMAQTLSDKGVTNQVMNFQGWMNGGYYHDVPDRIKVQRQLGSKKDLEELSKAVESLGGEFYADVAFQNVTYIAKRYRYTEESSRYYGAGYSVSFGEVNPANLRRTASLGYSENLYDLLSPRFLPYYVSHFVKEMEDIDISGVSLRDLGYEVHSDKKRTRFINREEALMVVEAQLDALQAMGRKLMITGGNDYALEGVQHVLAAPLSATEYFIVDDAIPLYQMVVHGCVDYAGKAFNTMTSENVRKDLLQMIEYGASPRYVFTWEDATEMKYTGLNKYYATTFASWADEAAENYRYVNDALRQVRGEAMTAHESLSDTLKKVTYSSGTVIYVNYGDKDAQADGYTVPAADYLVMGGVK